MTTTPVPIPGPLGLGDLLDRAFRLYRAHFWPLLGIAALVLVPVALIDGLLTGSVMASLVDIDALMLTETPEDIDWMAGTFGVLGTLMVTTVVYAIATGFASLALTAHNVAALQQKPIRIGEGLRIALRRFWTYLGMSVLRWLATLAVIVLAILPIMCVLVAWLAAIGTAEGDSTLAVAGFLVLTLIMYAVAFAIYLVPTVYLSARWIVTLPGIVESSWGAVAALRGSWRLTRGNVWRCVGYLVLLGLLNAAIANVPGLLLNQIVGIAMPDNLMLAAVLSQIASSLFAILWLPLSVAATVLLYYDLRVRNEGYDLALRIVQMEAATVPPHTSEQSFLPPAAAG
jgi:hypothetical protein